MDKYVIKNSGKESVVKVYADASSGGTIDMPLSDLAENGETVTGATITEIFWTCKPNKSVDIHRVTGGGELEGSYYLANAGHWHFLSFNDESYSTLPFRFVFDGYGTVIIRLRKQTA